MAIQLNSNPVIKIDGNDLDGYVFLGFKMTKRLLEPNRFEFVFQKADMSLDVDDITFELRERLLGALVECSVSANRLTVDNDWCVDEVDNFFKGYIQNVKVERDNMKAPFKVRCVAYSPDARLKQFPSCSSRMGDELADYVLFILRSITDEPRKFDKDSGKYDGWAPIDYKVEPRTTGPIPYTVQYHESHYDFLKRLAKRYGEFFYYEDGTIVFGKMNEKDPVTMRTGFDIEDYSYDLNMNHHTGIVLADFDYLICRNFGAGIEKGDAHNWTNPLEPPHKMAQSAFEHATEFFNDDCNSVIDCRSSRFVDESNSQNLAGSWNEADQKSITASEIDVWPRDQRRIVEQYVMADTVICEGHAARADLKLGSVIVIEDETNPNEGSTNYVQHEPLKVIDLTYEWVEGSTLVMTNHFKAIPQGSVVPPYLERDEQGFLTYGDFDIFVKSGPQHARVLDNRDPMGLGRVQVVMQWQWEHEYCMSQIEDIHAVLNNYSPWIRVAQPYGGYHRGCYIVPEIDDEVLVGFEHNNIERPYVIGNMFNSLVDHPVTSWVEDDVREHNEYKAFRTRNGHTIEIRDKDEHGYIKIYDEKTHNYVVTYDTDKKLIRLESKGNIELVADRNIVLRAGNNIKMDAKNNIDSYAENDINRTAENNVKDTAGNDYMNEVGNDFNTWISETDTHVHMVKDKIHLELKDHEKIITMSEADGVEIHADNNIALASKDKAGMVGKSKAVVQSDLEVDVKAKQLNMEGEIEANLKAAICKIN